MKRTFTEQYTQYTHSYNRVRQTLACYISTSHFQHCGIFMYLLLCCVRVSVFHGFLCVCVVCIYLVDTRKIWKRNFCELRAPTPIQKGLKSIFVLTFHVPIGTEETKKRKCCYYCYSFIINIIYDYCDEMRLMSEEKLFTVVFVMGYFYYSCFYHDINKQWTRTMILKCKCIKIFLWDIKFDKFI